MRVRDRDREGTQVVGPHPLTVVGLDISTSIVGIAVVRKDAERLAYDLSHIDLRKHETFWTKADVAVEQLSSMLSEIGEFALYAEDPMLSFSPGMSSAQTISMLAKFNFVLCYEMHRIFGVEPVHLNVNEARKLCGIRVQRKSKCGLSAKEQVSLHMRAADLSSHTWPTKRSKKEVPDIVDWAGDEIDAYVVAKAAFVKCGLHT